jgi:hypothetical protein
MNRLFAESVTGVLTVFTAGILSEQWLTNPELKFAVPLAVGILWSAGMLYRVRKAENGSS